MRDVLIGRTDNGDRVYAEAQLTERIGGETVTHEEAGEYLEFTMTGLVVAKYVRREYPYHIGQCLDALLDITEPAPGFTPSTIVDMHDTWKRWHLNGMNAGCAHQKVRWEDSDYGRRPSLTKTLPCPITGYRYGTAWLSEPLPEHIVTTVNEFIETGVWTPRKEG